MELATEVIWSSLLICCFLKWQMYTKPPHNRTFSIPKKYNWEKLVPLRGSDLEAHYTNTLRDLGKEKGILGQIFTKSQNKIQDPASSARL
jgi:type I restriction enzyme M protein